MTDEEPEPFRMPAEPDAEEAPAPDDDQPGADAADAAPNPRAESIADLIDEAARTAAEQDAAEERGHAPQDRSADVWGEPAEEAPAHGTDAVWQQAEDDAATNVWDLDDDDDAMWGSAGAPIHERAPTGEAAPTDDPTPPSETFTFEVGDDPTPPARASGASGAGAEDAHGAHDQHDEEPEPFSFPAGPDTTAPAALPTHSGDEEPETFSFPVTDDQPAAGSDGVEEWTVPGADDDEDTDVDDEVWTFSVTSGQDTPLADSATPRDDAGWHDLEAQQEPGWEVSDLAPRVRTGGPDDEPEAFTAALGGPGDDEDDDAPWSSPALPDEQDDGPPARAATAEVQDALGELLGDGDAAVETGGPVDPAGAPPAGEPPAADPPAAATPAAATPAPDPGDVAGDAGLDDFDHLDDLDDLDDLEHLDDMAAAAVPAVGHAPDDAADDETGDSGDADDWDAEDAEAAEVDQPLDAPTAARQVMEPGAVTFSSGGKKKRGLFG